MNLVGKILVVALLVMALVFSSFTLAVHATHKNWKLMVDNSDAQKGPLGLKQVIAERDTVIGRLQAELTNKQQLYDRTVRESEQVRGQLESTNAELDKGRRTLQTEIADKTSALTEAINNAIAAVNVLGKTQEENKNLRLENTTVKTERDQSFEDLVKKGDEFAQAAGEWSRLAERNKQLLIQLAQYRLVLQDRNLPLNLETPTVYGLVKETHTTEKMVEINLGTDDGLKKGDLLEVFRVGNSQATTRYLGQIRLSTVDKTGAVGNIIPDTLKGTIQKDDHVATRIE